MQVEQKKQEKSDAITLHLNVFDFFNIEENVSVNLGEAKQDTQDFEVAVVLDILVGHLAAPLALFKAVVIILKLTNNFGERTTLNANKILLGL